MSSAPRDTADDRPPATLEDRLGSADGSTVSPAGWPSSESPPLAPAQAEEPIIAPDEPAMRVAALVMLVGLVGLAGWWVVYSLRLLVDVLADRIPRDVAVPAWSLLLFVAFLPPIVRRLWLVARRGVDLTPEKVEAIESRAFLEAVERHDRLVEAQRLAAEGTRDERDRGGRR